MIDKNIPMQAQDELIEQAQDTFNFLQTCQTNSELSTYSILDGPYNFTKTPNAPSGTKTTVNIDPKTEKLGKLTLTHIMVKLQKH